MIKLLRCPVFAGNLCLFPALAAVLAAAVFFIGCEMNVSESPVLDEIEAAYRGLQGGGVIPPGTTFPDGGQTGGEVSYRVTDDGTGLEVSGGQPDANGLLRIPPEVDGLPVVEIGSDCFEDNKSIKRLDLSGCSALTEIWPYAFDGCTNLVSVDFSGCVKLDCVRAGAFARCPLLTKVDFSGCPDLRFYGANVFLGCTGLQELHLPRSMKENSEEETDSSYHLKTTSIAGLPKANGYVPLDQLVIYVCYGTEEDAAWFAETTGQKAEPCPEHR